MDQVRKRPAQSTHQVVKSSQHKAVEQPSAPLVFYPKCFQNIAFASPELYGKLSGILTMFCQILPISMPP